MKIIAAAALSALIAAPAFSQSNEYALPPRSQAAAATDQIIVKWRNGATLEKAGAPAQRASKLSSLSGVGVQHKRRSTTDTDVFKLDRIMDGAEMRAVLERIAADSQVEYAVADKWRRIQQLPTDPRINEQWYFVGAQTAATHADQAWDITTGSSSTVVAVLDTGVRYEHPDLGRASQGGKILDGYDFVTNVAVANDGDARDADASDPGDWLTSAELGTPAFASCGGQPGDSSWHGTRVSSLIGALSNEANGMAGTGWSTLILPVRVLGKCGGFDSDIIAGMLWAAGLTVSGVPANPTPAKILNLSLGGDDACSAAYQDAVNQISAQGSLIVASVGNDGVSVGTPANCSGVLGVAGLRHAGTKVGYSNLGPGADIAAPAGNCVNATIGPGSPCVYSILAAIDNGDTVPTSPGYTDPVNSPNFGTSFSAPLVAGAAALMHSVNSRLGPAQFTTLIQESATTFPTVSDSTPQPSLCLPPNIGGQQGGECICTTATCGAGMLNTFAAVAAARKPFAIAQAPAQFDVGATVNIDGSTSFAANSRTVASYQWSVTGVNGATPTIANAAQAATTLQVSGTTTFTLRLTVTDDQGTQDTADVAMTTQASQPSNPPSTPIGSGGGGGGSFDWWLLVLGLLPLALPGLSRRRLRVRSNSRRHRAIRTSRGR